MTQITIEIPDKLMSRLEQQSFSVQEAHRLKVFEIFAFDDHIRQMGGLGIICVP